MGGFSVFCLSCCCCFPHRLFTGLKEFIFFFISLFFFFQMFYGFIAFKFPSELINFQ